VFRAVPMVRLQAVVLERDEHAVLRGLGQLSAVQFTRVEPGPDTAPLPPRDRPEELARCNRIQTRCEAVRKSLGDQSAPGIRRTVEMDLNEAEERLTAMEERITGPAERRLRLMERKRELTELFARSSCYRGLGIPLDGDDQFSYLHFATGTLPAQNLEYLESNVGRNTILLSLGQQKGRQSLLAVTTNRGRPVLESALEQAGFQRELLPEIRGATIDTLHEEGEREQAELEAELKVLQSELSVTATDFEQPLREIEALADVEFRLIEAGQKFPRTEAAVLITGWAPAHAASVLERRIKETTDGRCALRVVPPDGSGEDRVPVLLHHSWLLRPFETLVSTYGLPGYRELEPTIFVALSYVLMFGMMFGDAGHGLVLAAGGLFVLTRASKKAHDFGLLLLFAGSSSIVFGTIYGSYFGIGLFKKYAIWHDPLEGDPIRLMYFTIGFGIIMISLGLVLNVINRFRRGDVIGGFLDKFGIAGVLFYWGALALLVKGPFFESRGLTGAGMAVFLALPIVGWMIKEPLEHVIAQRASRGTGGTNEAAGGMAEAVTESLVGAFEAVLGYLANTISFVRLAAYAMSHAALLVAAFMLAAQVREFPLGGSLWSVVVIILGNVAAIVLEGIIASVQALRLEYYEFFGKFFSGNGQPFEPFHLAEGGETSA
jgi:V/A-type H+/Na+-transporting ATPase subunit I